MHEIIAYFFKKRYTRYNETSEAEKEELRRLKAEIDKKLRGEGLDHE